MLSVISADRNPGLILSRELEGRAGRWPRTRTRVRGGGGAHGASGAL